MMTNKLVPFAVCLAFVASGTAYAGTRYSQPSTFIQLDSRMGKVVGGIVNGDGSLVYGKGFQVSHPATGQYVITIPGTAFSKCPVVNVTPAGAGGSSGRDSVRLQLRIERRGDDDLYDRRQQRRSGRQRFSLHRNPAIERLPRDPARTLKPK